MAVEFFYCSCCGYKTVTDTHDVCRICRWEWDEVQDQSPDRLGSNPVTLRTARANFEIFGARDEDALPHVTPPGDEDERDPGWPAWPKRGATAEILDAASSARVRRSKLSETELQEHLKIAVTGAARERESAIDALCGHIDAHDVDPPEIFAAWLEVVRRTVREFFPGSRLGYVALNHWMRHDLDGARGFMLHEVSLEARGEEEWRELADVFARLTSFPDVLARLRSLADGEGAAAEWAAYVLELEKPMRRETDPG